MNLRFGQLRLTQFEHLPPRTRQVGRNTYSCVGGQSRQELYQIDTERDPETILLEVVPETEDDFRCEKIIGLREQDSRFLHHAPEDVSIGHPIEIRIINYRNSLQLKTTFHGYHENFIINMGGFFVKNKDAGSITANLVENRAALSDVITILLNALPRAGSTVNFQPVARMLREHLGAGFEDIAKQVQAKKEELSIALAARQGQLDTLLQP